MENKLNLNGKLDFKPIDLTAPDTVVNELLAQLPEQTHGYIFGKIQSYSGEIYSYRRTSISDITLAFTGSKEVDVQDSLGVIGEESKRFECYLYTSVYKNYKYRLFFLEYNLSHYPVKLVLEQSIAKSLPRSSDLFVFSINSRSDLEELVTNILTCKRTINIMQEIIRIHQAKAEDHYEPLDTTDDNKNVD